MIYFCHATWFFPLLIAVSCGSREPSSAAELPVPSRFAVASSTEIPDFRRHVIPLLGKLGCNGRSCHGSINGQGGFKLSLFGYDFEADHKTLVSGEPLRANWKSPPRSLLLRKPALLEDHEGGQLFEPGSWQYQLLYKWVAGRARGVARLQRDLMIETLEMLPADMLLSAPGERVSLTVVATWSDGTRENVTQLCRFQSTDPSIVEVESNGTVVASRSGTAHVLGFYDNAIALSEATLPVSELQGDRFPDLATPTEIDRLVVGQLRRLGIQPAERCRDTSFLRRVNLDITGTLPRSDEVQEFLADEAPNKRSRKINELLATPAYAARWTAWLCDLTGNFEPSAPDPLASREQTVQWYDWIYQRVRRNVSYDQIVEGIVTGTSRRAGQSYTEYCREMSGYFRLGTEGEFSQRDDMPYYWARASLRKPEERVIAVSYSFLGVRLQCAQCHKHPFDRWTKQDFQNFAGFFQPIRYGIPPQDKAEFERLRSRTHGSRDGKLKRSLATAARQGKVIPWREVYVQQDARGRPVGKSPKGEEIVWQDTDDPRQKLMAWMRDPQHPYLAVSFVNRVWAAYFGVGIVDPPDDLSVANPPSNRPLLDYLSQQFIAHDYDMLWLHREIANSDAYQRSCTSNPTNVNDRRHFSRALLRRLPAEVAYDAVVQASLADEALSSWQHDVSRRMIGWKGRLTKGQRHSFALRVLGQPRSSSNCDCDRDNRPTLQQAIYLQNDGEVRALIERRGGWVDQASQRLRDSQIDPLKIVRQAYLRTLSRNPTEAEVKRAREFLAGAASDVEGLRDLLWALVNTKEFIVNR